MQINKELKKRRMELGITMKEVADIVGVSEGTISRWESGDISNMRRDKIALYAKALLVTTNFIMGIDDDSPVLSEKETAVALAYRAHPALQPAVDKLLEIEQEEQPKKYLLLVGKGGSADVEIKDPKGLDEEVEKLKKKHGLK